MKPLITPNPIFVGPKAFYSWFFKCPHCNNNYLVRVGQGKDADNQPHLPIDTRCPNCAQENHDLKPLTDEELGRIYSRDEEYIEKKSLDETDAVKRLTIEYTKIAETML